VPPNLFFAGYLLQERQDAFYQDVKLLFKMCADQFESRLAKTELPLETDHIAFLSFKETWAKLRFSLLQFSITKEESKEEFY
jgi:hypothetical protein